MLFKPFKFRLPKTRKRRVWQIERFNSKPNPISRISENSVQPQKDEGTSPKALPTVWTNVPSQLNPDRDKIFNFSTKISDQKFGVNLDSACQQIKSYFPWLDLMLSASSTLKSAV